MVDHEQSRRNELERVAELARRTRPLGAGPKSFEASSARLVRLGVVTIALLVGTVTSWATVTTIAEVAVAPGEVVTTGTTRSVQHLEGGILADVFVKEGQRVASGELLAKFDGTAARTELERMKVRRVSLVLRAERLSARAEDREPDFGSTAESHPRLVKGELAILRSQRAAMASEYSILREQSAQRRLELKGLRSQSESLSRQIKLLGEEVTMRQRLFERDAGSRLLLVKAEHSLSLAEGEQMRNSGSRATALAAVREFERRKAEIALKARSEALEELGEVRAELAEVDETIQGLEDRVARLEVRSPVSGVVQFLPVRTERGVLPPGGLIAEVVPEGDPLLVEARISTNDIGFVRPGQDVTLKVQTFNFARYGKLSGRLESVSATTFSTDDGDSYYKGRISLAQNYVGEDASEHVLQPGMTVQADINTGEKTLMEYILKPIYTNLDESFRER